MPDSSRSSLSQWRPAHDAAAVVVVGVSVLARVARVDDPATLMLHSVRQMTVAMQARNFSVGGVSILRPSVDLAPIGKTPPVFEALEFPIYAWLMAALQRLFGVHIWLGSVLSILFFGLASWLFYLVAKRLLDHETAALLAVLVFVFSPEGYKFTRTVQPDTLSLLLFLGIMYLTFRWLDTEETGASSWLLSAISVCSALLLLNKVNWAPLLIAPVGIVGVYRGFRRLRRSDVIIAAVASLVPAAVWYSWSNSAADIPMARLVMTDRSIRYLGTSWRSPNFYTTALDAARRWETLAGVIVSAVGGLLVLLDLRSRKHQAIAVWLLATGAYVYVQGPNMLAAHAYYFLPVLPLFSLLVAAVADFVLGRSRLGNLERSRLAYVGGVCLAAVAMVAAAVTILAANSAYERLDRQVEAWNRGASLVAEHTRLGEHVLYVTESQGISLYLSYVSGHRGWSDTGSTGADFAGVVSFCRARGVSAVFVSKAPFASEYRDASSAPEARRALDRQRAALAGIATPVAENDMGTLMRMDSLSPAGQ